MVFNPTFTNTDSSGHRTDRDGFGARHNLKKTYYDTRWERDIVKATFIIRDKDFNEEDKIKHDFRPKT